MTKIDSHVHYVGDDADSLATLARLDLKLLNVCVVHEAAEDWRDLARRYKALAAETPSRFAWCTSFDLPDFSPDYVDRVIESLERDFADGAVACKFWKNIGMALRKPTGEFLLIDDDLFDPIYEYLIAAGKPALMHIAEPLACWQPLDEKNGHRGYYSQHPEWHMYGKRGYPSHQELIDSRDRVVAKHPRLRTVAAHLGSLEFDVAEVAKRLRQFPNLAVDTSARAHNLARQDSEAVRQLFLAYPDQLLFGTDIVQRDSRLSLSPEVRQAQLSALDARYVSEFSYYESDASLAVRGIKTRGLGLPATVLDRFYRANAERWYPGL